jgi:hypothetical protein
MTFILGKNILQSLTMVALGRMAFILLIVVINKATIFSGALLIFCS